MTFDDVKQHLIGLLTDDKQGIFHAQTISEACQVLEMDCKAIDRIDDWGDLNSRLTVLDRQANRFFSQWETEETRAGKQQCAALGIAASVAGQYCSAKMAAIRQAEDRVLQALIGSYKPL